MIAAARYAAVVMLLAGVDRFNENRPLQVNMWSVEAIQRNGVEPYCDPALSPIRAAFKGLPYNTYRLINNAEYLAPLNETTSTTVSSDYTFCLTPQAVRPDGRFEIDVTVDLPPAGPGAPPAHALATKLIVQPDKLVMLEGFKGLEGDLMIVFAAHR